MGRMTARSANIKLTVPLFGLVCLLKVLSCLGIANAATTATAAAPIGGSWPEMTASEDSGRMAAQTASYA